jgi:hypothetical protein
MLGQLARLPTLATLCRWTKDELGLTLTTFSALTCLACPSLEIELIRDETFITG